MLRLAILFLSATALVIGCDRKPRPVERDDPPPSATTQHGNPEITGAKRVSRQIGDYPLRMELPEPWKMTTSELATVIHGDTPHGLAIIVVSPMTAPGSSRPFLLSPEQMKLLSEEAEQGLKNEPDRYLALERIKVGAAQVLDVTTAMIPTTAPTTAAPTTQPQSIRRRISMYVPAGDRFVSYQISYEQAPAEFAADKAFMQSVLETLTYDASLDTLPRLPTSRESDEWRKPADFRREDR